MSGDRVLLVGFVALLMSLISRVFEDKVVDYLSTIVLILCLAILLEGYIVEKATYLRREISRRGWRRKRKDQNPYRSFALRRFKKRIQRLLRLR